jgi:hypothetical protein
MPCERMTRTKIKHYHAEIKGECRGSLSRTVHKLRCPGVKCSHIEKGLTYKMNSCSENAKAISKLIFAVGAETSS